MEKEYAKQTAALDVKGIADKRRRELKKCVDDKDIPTLMVLYDNKGVISIAAGFLKDTNVASFKSWIIRLLGDDKAPEITRAFGAVLPEIKPR